MKRRKLAGRCRSPGPSMTRVFKNLSRDLDEKSAYELNLSYAFARVAVTITDYCPSMVSMDYSLPQI